MFPKFPTWNDLGTIQETLLESGGFAGAPRFRDSMKGGTQILPILRGGAQILPNTNYRKTEIAQIRSWNIYMGVIKRFMYIYVGGYPDSAKSKSLHPQ